MQSATEHKQQAERHERASNRARTKAKRAPVKAAAIPLREAARAHNAAAEANRDAAMAQEKAAQSGIPSAMEAAREASDMAEIASRAAERADERGNTHADADEADLAYERTHSAMLKAMAEAGDPGDPINYVMNAAAWVEEAEEIGMDGPEVREAAQAHAGAARAHGKAARRLLDQDQGEPSPTRLQDDATAHSMAVEAHERAARMWWRVVDTPHEPGVWAAASEASEAAIRRSQDIQTVGNLVDPAARISKALQRDRERNRGDDDLEAWRDAILEAVRTLHRAAHDTDDEKVSAILQVVARKTLKYAHEDVYPLVEEAKQT